MKGGVIIRKKDIEELEWASIDPSLKTYKTFCSEFSFNDKNYMNFDWIEKQLEYINNLSQYEKDIVYSYTKYGDILVNNYLRNTLSQELLDRTIQDIQNNINHPLSSSKILLFNTKDSLITSIDKFTNELKRIISNAPRSSTPIKVFRGIRDSRHIEKIHDTKDINGFLSTTLYLPSTELFMDYDCCLLEITISPNIPCLFIAPVSKEPGEYEILIDNTVKLTILNKIIKKFLDIPNFHTLGNLLNIVSDYELEEKQVYECIITN